MSEDSRFIRMHDTYFRRFLVPVVITCLVLALFFVIVTDTSDAANTTPIVALFGGSGAATVARLFQRKR